MSAVYLKETDDSSFDAMSASYLMKSRRSVDHEVLNYILHNIVVSNPRHKMKGISLMVVRKVVPELRNRHDDHLNMIAILNYRNRFEFEKKN